jgi:hypothetical protein
MDSRGRSEPGASELPNDIEDSSGVPQVSRRRLEGSGTSHKAFSENFCGMGGFSWGTVASLDLKLQRLLQIFSDFFE